MEFKLDPDIELVRRVSREFARNHFDEKIARIVDEKEEFPWEIYKLVAEQRLLRPSIPEEYGGGGFNMLAESIVHEEFTRVDSTLGQAVLSGAFGSKLIYLYGTEHQKRKYLKRVLNGESVMYAAFTEPGHGSDITKLDTKAVRKGDRWIISGVKTFITNAPIAEFGIVLCQMDGDDKPYRHQIMFIVDNDQQGVKINPLKGKMGQRGSPIGEVILENVELNEENILGRPGRGFYQALNFFSYGRVRAASNALGMALNALDKALEYATEREQFGTKIIDFQAVSHKLAVMTQLIEASRLLTYRAAWALDEENLDNRVKSIYAAIAKRFSTEAAWKVVDMALQIFGGYGYMKDFNIERIMRDLRVLRIYEGTSEILNEVILHGLKNKYYEL